MAEYLSLFDIIESKDTGFFNPNQDKSEKESLSQFHGNIFQAIDFTKELFDKVLNNGIDGVNPYEIANLLLMNQRILRGILDYKNCSQGEFHNFYPIIRLWIQLSISLYQLQNGVLKDLESLRNDISLIGNFDMLQRFDSETWNSINPYYLFKTSQFLVNDLGRDTFVFIALGHGGIIPGLDVYLRIISQLDQESFFYPIRFSRAKKKDKNPRVSQNGENTYLSEVFQGGKVLVLFDEDAYSGNTLLQAEKYFGENFSGIKRIVKVSNIGKFAPK